MSKKRQKIKFEIKNNSHAFFANKAMIWIKFAGAEYLPNSNKMWLGFVQDKGNLPYGQINFKNTKVPWLEVFIDVTEERREFLMSFLHRPFGTTTACWISGDGKFTRLIDVLTVDEQKRQESRLRHNCNIGEAESPLIEGDIKNE